MKDAIILWVLLASLAIAVIAYTVRDEPVIEIVLPMEG